MIKKKMIRTKTVTPAKQNCRGFTLIELSIVLLILSILLIHLIQLYSNYIGEQNIKITRERVIDASRALSLSSPIRYPCPSDRSLPPTNANYGADVCSIAGFTLAGIPNCNATGQEQGICKTPGVRDTSDDIDLVAGNNNEFVLVGGVPLKIGTTSIGGISGGNILDAWGNQLSYAVSFTSSRPNRTEGFTRFKNGVIRVTDEWGNNTAGTANDAQFFVFSHGQNGLGAFNSSFVRRDCITTTIEGENCDGDSTFVQGISHFDGTIRYDDYSYTKVDNSAQLWRVVVDTTNPGTPPTTHIITIPIGKLGVNTTTPGTTPPAGVDVRLDVAGNIRADTVRSVELCKKDGSRCMTVDSPTEFFGSQKTAAVGGVRNDCGDGQVISAISNSQVQCSLADIQFTGAQVRCPVTTWVEQILTNGRIKCTGGIICPGGVGCL